MIYDAIVIGSGIAGLTSAALLQRDGLNVLLLEAHDKPGGCAGFFHAGEWQFPVGATVALGFEKSGLHRRVFDYLDVHDYEAHLLDGLKILLPDRSVTIHRHPKQWRLERDQLPGNRLGQDRFWRLQEIIADAGWRALSKLPSLPPRTWADIGRDARLIHPSLALLGPSQFATVGQLMRLLNVHRDREFRALVDLLLIISVQQSARHTPLANACAGMDLFRHGAFALRGGMGTLARLLLQSFEQEGGTICFNQAATKVRRDEHSVWEIETATSKYFGARVIANLPLPNVRRLVEMPIELNEKLAKRESRDGEQWGAVNAFIGVREEAIPSDAPLHFQVLSDYKHQAGDGRDVFLSLSLPEDTSQAPLGWRALNISTHTRLRDWKDLSADEYKQRKHEWRERLLDGARRAIPNLDEHRKFVIMATPHSWQHYTQREDGGVGGTPLRIGNANLFAVPRQIELENFWLTGDSTFPGQGTVACALSGINVWRDITGQKAL